MSSQDNNNNNNTGNNNNSYEGMELFEEEIKFYEEAAKESNKRAREEEDSDNEELKAKRQREENWDENDDNASYGTWFESDSVSDDGEESETDRINTKLSKRFDAIQDYKEKNELLSEMSIKNVMDKLDKGEILSKQEFETLERANRLMDQDILKDKDSIQRMQLYEDFYASVQKEISNNNKRIKEHEENISDYHELLDDIDQANNKELSDNDSSNFDEGSNSDSNDNGNNDSNNPSNPSGPDDDDDDDDGFDDFPPSFDFDDF